MANEDEFHPERLSVDQIERFFSYIIDKFGSGLSPEDLDESIRVVMENVPGIELDSTPGIERLLD